MGGASRGTHSQAERGDGKHDHVFKSGRALLRYGRSGRPVSFKSEFFDVFTKIKVVIKRVVI